MRYVPELETLFTNGFVTVNGPGLTQADVGKAVELTSNKTVQLASDGSAVFGRLHSIDPKGDGVVVVQVAGYVALPVASASQGSIAVGNGNTGYVIGAGNGEVKVLSATPTVTEALNAKKVVDVKDSGATAVVDLGAKIS